MLIVMETANKDTSDQAIVMSPFSVCNEEFVNKQSLKSHEREHRNNSSFICKTCGKNMLQSLLHLTWERNGHPAIENLTEKIPKPTQVPQQQAENLKARLRQAYKAVTRANRNSHMANKERYDRRAKHHSFNVGDYVYLYDPAQKPGLSKKFHFYWTCPYQTTGKLSDLNYEVQGAAAKT